MPEETHSWNEDYRKLVILALIPLFIVLVVILVVFPVPAVFEPPYLLLVLNAVFLGAIPLYIAYLTNQTYLSQGHPGVLLIGTGMLVMGLSAIIAGGTISLAGGPNMTVTIHNTSVFIGGILAFLSSLAVIFHPSWLDQKRRALFAAIFYGGAFLFVLLFSIATLQGATPLFFVQGTGPTLLRQAILTSAIVFFSVSSLLFSLIYTRKKEDFFFWLSLAFGFMAIGLLSVGLQPAVGSPIGWLGRITQYTGALCALVAFVVARRDASAEGVPVDQMVARFFGEAEAGYQALVEASSSAIVVIDPDERILVWNPAAERMFGYTRREAVGSPISLMGTDPAFMTFLRERGSPRRAKDERQSGDDHIETTALRKDGSSFPIDMSVSGHRMGIAWARTCIIQDITRRKRNDEEFQQVRTMLAESQRIAHLGSFEFVAATRTTVWSEEEYRIYGLDPAGPSPEYDVMLATCIHPADAALLHETFTRAMQSHSIYELEHRIVRPDGSERWVYDRAYPYFDEKGALVRYIGATLDITDRKQAGEALRESEGRFRALTENSSLAIGVSSADGKFLYCNTAYEKLFGYTAEELGQVDASALWWNPDDRIAMIDALGKQGHILDYEAKFKRRGGTSFFGLLSLTRIEYDGAQAIMGTIHDISPRKFAEDALHQKQAEIQALFDNIPAGLVLFDATTPSYAVLVHNLYYQGLFAEPYQSNGMRGLSVYDFAPDVVESGVIAVFDEVVSTQQPKQFLDFLFRSDAENERWFNWYLAPIVIDGKVVTLVSMSLDVTAWHRAEEAVRKARDELEQRVLDRTAQLNDALGEIQTERHRLYEVLESIPAMVCLITEDYHVAWANRSFRQYFGESMGRPCYVYCHGKDSPCEFCESFTPLKTGKPHQWEVKTLDGSVVSCHDYPFTDTDGTRMILEMDIDITEQRRTEQELVKARDQLEDRVRERTNELEVYVERLKQSNQELEQFAYIASHDLKEPLRMVTSFSQLLERNYRGRLDADADEFISYIVDGGKKMEALVNDLLEFSRITTRGKPFLPTDLNEIFRESLKSLSIMIRENNAKVEAGTLPVAPVDRSQIGQVFQNLLSNAIKFHGLEPPVVSIKAVRNGNEWVISFRDNGIGIDPAYYEKIFEIFQRLHPGSSYPGTGIGLAVCKKIIERHGGRIWVESELEKGSTFFFTIPVERKE